MPVPILFLAGARGSGKTTVGRTLAARLSFSFLDTDALIVARAGTDVAGIVASRGWEGFRDAESEALEEAIATANQPGLVVATGGGMILREANRARMRETGCVVYLRAEPEVLAERLRRDPLTGQRPALTDKSLEDEIRQVLDEREPLYQAAAHLVLDAGAELPVLVERLTMEHARWREARARLQP
jgi:shikimate kinase